MNASTSILITSIVSIGFLIIMYFYIKILFRLEKRIKQIEKYILETEFVDGNQTNVSNSVATGLVKGLQQMREDDEKHLKLLEMSRQLQRTPQKVISGNSISKYFDTGGELIPSNLTKEEEEILRMYYDRSNER